jgi:PAS domain S-box-containing protein
MHGKSNGNGRRDDWHLTGDIPIEHGKGDPFAAAIRATRMAMIITDPRREDNPIVFANDAFLRLSGYAREEVIGYNCRFLQGPETDHATVDRIRDAIALRQDINVDILNYRKNGSTFWNALYLSPVFNEDGELQFFFSSQLDITDRKDAEMRVRAEKERFERAVGERTAELQAALEAQTALLHEVDHRVKNNLQMISSLIVMQSRTIPDQQIRASLRTMLERVEAMSTVHRRLYQSDDVTRFDLADFARDLVTDLVAASGKPITLEFALDPVDVPAERAAPVALIVNELVTNAIKHAFADGHAGTIRIAVTREGNTCRIEVSDDGPGIDGASPGNGTSFGMKLIRALAKQLGADLSWTEANPGTRAVMKIPLGAKAGPLGTKAVARAS